MFLFYFISDNLLKDLKNVQDENKTYLFTYSLIGIVNSIATFFRAFIFAYGGIKACTMIHDKLLASIMYVCISLYIFCFNKFNLT